LTIPSQAKEVRMQIIGREDLQEIRLPGRVLQKVVGKDGQSRSRKMTMGFAHYSAQSGPMEPHQHAEEICYIIAAKAGWVRFGPSRENLRDRRALRPGMTLHVDELEWHVFEYDDGGFVDIIFFYGQVDNIRPEAMKRG
jgi:hypothetical protein